MDMDPTHWRRLGLEPNNEIFGSKKTVKYMEPAPDSVVAVLIIDSQLGRQFFSLLNQILLDNLVCDSINFHIFFALSLKKTMLKVGVFCWMFLPFHCNGIYYNTKCNVQLVTPCCLDTCAGKPSCQE